MARRRFGQRRVKRALRVAFGEPGAPFAAPWRFWTYGDSAYLAHRSLAAVFKASFHPAGSEHQSATWTFGFTKESKQRFVDVGSRRGKTWPQQPEFKPGWYRGPAVSVPRLPDRSYDLPPIAAEFRGAAELQWVNAPQAGSAVFLMVFLSDDRDELPPLVVGDGDTVLGTLPIASGWHLSVVSTTRPLSDDELRPVFGIRDELKANIDQAPRSGSTSGAVIWVSESPDGPPLFVHIVLGSDNFVYPMATERDDA